LVGKLKERDYLEELDVCERIIVKLEVCERIIVKLDVCERITIKLISNSGLSGEELMKMGKMAELFWKR
jgi:hypothetical protein